jgi:hypothetical protein
MVTLKSIYFDSEYSSVGQKAWTFASLSINPLDAPPMATPEDLAKLKLDEDRKAAKEAKKKAKEEKAKQKAEKAKQGTYIGGVACPTFQRQQRTGWL